MVSEQPVLTSDVPPFSKKSTALSVVYECYCQKGAREFKENIAVFHTGVDAGGGVSF